MKLSAFTSQRRREIHEQLQAGLLPSQGRYDESALRAAQVKGAPQMGTVRYAPHEIALEFIYTDHQGAQVVTITLDAPERIVFLPVPGWVIESIWQGEIDGSYHFERDARELISQFLVQVEPGANADLFGPKAATRRE